MARKVRSFEEQLAISNQEEERDASSIPLTTRRYLKVPWDLTGENRTLTSEFCRKAKMLRSHRLHVHEASSALQDGEVPAAWQCVQVYDQFLDASNNFTLTTGLLEFTLHEHLHPRLRNEAV